MENSKVFERLKNLAESRGTSVSALATRLTGSLGNLATWKKGKIRTDWLIAICEKFGVSADYILGIEAPTTAPAEPIVDANVDGSPATASGNRAHNAAIVDSVRGAGAAPDQDGFMPRLMEMYSALDREGRAMVNNVILSERIRMLDAENGSRVTIKDRAM